MKPSTASTLAALRDGTKTTHELMQAGGRNFPARVHELRHQHGFHISERYVRPGQHAYTLLASKPGPLTWPGPFKVCTRCSWTWDASGSARGCPKCEAGSHWLMEFLTEAPRDLAASRVNAMDVARELKHLAALREHRAAVAA